MKRIRAGGYHVKTGCKTCKIRHVKCDEEEPACSKCRSTGRVCDGYETKQSLNKPPQYISTKLFPADTTLKALSILPGPPISIDGTNQERRSFDFFYHQTGQQLSTALCVTKTHQLILQASHCDEVVKAAVIALGSIGERLLINNILTLENEQANACHGFAHLQYYKALKRLRMRISDNPEGSTDLTIIMCFLFTIFEFLQGNDTASLIHLRSGLDILRRNHGSLSTGLHAVSPNQDPLTYEIFRVFSIMDLQATIWLGLKTFQAPIMISIDVPGDGPAHLDVFSTLDEASESLNHQIVSRYHFQRLIAAYDTLDEAPPEMHAKRDKLITQQKKWPASLEALTKKLGREIDTEMSKRIVVMRMNHETNLLVLKACLQPSENHVYAAHEPEFRLVVDLAKSIIGPMNDLVKLGIGRIVAANNGGFDQPVPMFSFYAGVIQPLYLTAIKCQNLGISREAIALLSLSPWREGAWDSATMARIATRRFHDIEKEYMYRDPR